ncbi:hypothetical protein [Pedobacter steynii]
MADNQITAVTELDRSHYKTKVYAGGILSIQMNRNQSAGPMKA